MKIKPPIPVFMPDGNGLAIKMVGDEVTVRMDDGRKVILSKERAEVHEDGRGGYCIKLASN